MEAIITGEHSRRARSTSDRMPRVQRPIVVTKPIMRFSARACRACSFIHQWFGSFHNLVRECWKAKRSPPWRAPDRNASGPSRIG